MSQIPLLTLENFIARPDWAPLPRDPVALPDNAKILILKLSAIGDCLVASPVARALRLRYPGAHLAWAVQSKAKAVVEDNPHLDETLVWNGQWNDARRLIREIRARRFDAVVDLQGALKSAPFLTFSGAATRVISSRAEAIAQKGANFIVPMPSPPPHAAEQYLRVAGALDISPDAPRDLEMGLRDSEHAFAAQFLAQNGFNSNGVDGARKLLGLNPGAARAIKQWPPEQFARLGDLAHQSGVQTVLFGGPGEEELARKIADAMQTPPIFAAGKTNLKQLGALLQRCDLLVSGDTGPMHIAAGVGTRVLALFGPTDPFRTGPAGARHVVLARDLPCRPCFQKPTCKHFECLSQLRAEEVWTVAEKLLA